MKSLPNSQRAITREDVQQNRTFYVQHTDTDAMVIRFHGPKTLDEAILCAAELNACGHKGDVLATPERVIASVIR